MSGECVGANGTCALKGYDDRAPINARIDETVSVRVDENTNMVIIDGDLHFRPSEILHALDRIAYDDIVATLDVPGEMDEPEVDE